MPAMPAVTVIDMPPAITKIGCNTGGIISRPVIVEAGAESWIITGAQKHHTCRY
jgi:hypothetical protein